MRVLLGSGGIRTPEREAVFHEAVRAFFGAVERVLLIPYAGFDFDAYLERTSAMFAGAGYAVESIHTAADPVVAVRSAAALYVAGGNSFRLLRDLYRYDLLEPIRERVRAGMPFLGISAGANVAGPTIRTTNDMPITAPPSMDALGLVPFQINPHYFFGPTFVERDGTLVQHHGETRDERIAEFHQEHATPVVALWEGAFLRIEDGDMHLAGAPARLFRRGQAPEDVTPPAPLTL